MKPGEPLAMLGGGVVAPHAGARIETSGAGASDTTRSRRPPRGGAD